MCGIIGIIGSNSASTLILEGLRRLEYRGYDSAGIATVGPDGQLQRLRAEGKLANLEAALQKSQLNGSAGIGHTRWATHGAPNETNAHPHATGRVAVVHNGIIENYKQLREELESAGYSFSSQTDTEVIPILITAQLDSGRNPTEAVVHALSRLTGAFALGILFAGENPRLFAARRGSPLAIGYGENTMYLGSDAVALAPYTPRISYLEEGDWAELTSAGVTIHDSDNQPVSRAIKISAMNSASVSKGNYRHYMEKEIYEQPGIIGEALSVFLNRMNGTVSLPNIHLPLAEIDKITLVACGTSFYAALVARYWLETYARLPVEVDIASEFRYRTLSHPSRGLAICISQSGETADTLAAMRALKSAGQHCLAIVNMVESTMAKEADAVLPIHAGPEIGVASTKAFTAQLVTLACFTLALAQARGTLTAEELLTLVQALGEVPTRMAEVLDTHKEIETIAHEVAQARDVLYIGRGTSYAVALEGALKLKEISYIHAEGYAAGELKHGPIALIDDQVPVIAIAPSDALYEKTASNIQEAVARGGRIILLSDNKGAAPLSQEVYATVHLPETHPFVSPILYAIPVQLLAYHVAVIKGTDVDQPRNLAKSVTVE